MVETKVLECTDALMSARQRVLYSDLFWSGSHQREERVVHSHGVRRLRCSRDDGRNPAGYQKRGSEGIAAHHEDATRHRHLQRYRRHRSCERSIRLLSVYLSVGLRMYS